MKSYIREMKFIHINHSMLYRLDYMSYNRFPTALSRLHSILKHKTQLKSNTNFILNGFNSM